MSCSRWQHQSVTKCFVHDCEWTRLCRSIIERLRVRGAVTRQTRFSWGWAQLLDSINELITFIVMIFIYWIIHGKIMPTFGVSEIVNLAFVYFLFLETNHNAWQYFLETKLISGVIASLNVCSSHLGLVCGASMKVCSTASAGCCKLFKPYTPWACS